jgi:[protein-PII] uridylyltransferase
MEVRRFCRSTAIEREDAALIEFLVREHLTMSRIAQKSDLSDPDVIAAFAKQGGQRAYLTALYLLTVADIRGTSPKVWNAWKGKLLEDLYRATLRALGGHAPDLHAEVEARKRDALVMLACTPCPFEAHKALWDTLDVGYFMRHDAADIAWHTRHLSRHVGAQEPMVRARQSPVGEGLQVLVYTRTRATCSRAFAATSTRAASAFWTHASTRPATATRSTPSRSWHSNLPDPYRELISMVENGLARRHANGRPAAPAQPGPRVAPGQEFPDHAAREPETRRKGPALAAQHLGQRPGRPAVLRGAGAGAPQDQPATGQDRRRWASGSKTPS